MTRTILDYREKALEVVDHRPNVGDHGYIAIIETNPPSIGRTTVGVDYVVLDDNGHATAYAIRMNGDYLDAGEWSVVKGEAEFCGAVLRIAQHYLDEPEQTD